MFQVLNSIRQPFVRNELFKRRRRPKVSDSTVMRRKEIKKLRHVNIYSSDYTGERTYHPWLDPKRLRALMLAYQDFQNQHRHTVQIDKKDKKALLEQNIEYSQYKYYQETLHLKMLENAAKIQKDLQNDIETLPYNLRQEIKKKGYEAPKHALRPDQLKNYNLYYDQTQRMFPDDYIETLQLGKRFQLILDEKIGDHE